MEMYWKEGGRQQWSQKVEACKTEDTGKIGDKNEYNQNSRHTKKGNTENKEKEASEEIGNIRVVKLIIQETWCVWWTGTYITKPRDMEERKGRKESEKNKGEKEEEGKKRRIKLIIQKTGVKKK